MSEPKRLSPEERANLTMMGIVSLLNSGRDDDAAGILAAALKESYDRGRANGDTMIRELQLSFNEAVKLGTDIGRDCSFRAAGWAAVAVIVTSALWSIAT